MENRTVPNNGPSDEIDLGQLLSLIKKGLNNLFRFFLRFFVYLRRNAIKLGILAVVGLGIGIGLNQIITKRLKTDVIVKPNLESKNYLYDVVEEIDANIKAKDTVFFSQIGIDVEKLKGFNIQIQPVEKTASVDMDSELKYLELLEKFRNDQLIADVIRTEISNKSTLNHRISFLYNNAQTGAEYAEKLMGYINSNDYYKNLVGLYNDNAKKRIANNEEVIKQIDDLVANYSQNLGKDGKTSEGRILLDSEEVLDVPGLLGMKNSLTRDIERMKIDLESRKEPVRIINFGQPHEVQKAFFGKNVVLIPLILIGLYLLVDFIKYLNRKAKEMQL